MRYFLEGLTYKVSYEKYDHGKKETKKRQSFVAARWSPIKEIALSRPNCTLNKELFLPRTDLFSVFLRICFTGNNWGTSAGRTGACMGYNLDLNCNELTIWEKNVGRERGSPLPTFFDTDLNYTER